MNERQIILAIQALNMLQSNTGLVHHMAGIGETSEIRNLNLEITEAREALVKMLRARTAADRPVVKL